MVKTNVRGEPPIYVTWNHLHNLLLIRTSDKQALNEVGALIKRIDRPAQQVLLEMKILRATLGDEERSVFDYSYQSGQVDAGVDEDGNQLYTPKIDLSLGNFPLEGGAFLAKLAGAKLNTTIELLRTENRVHLLAQPNIISANNKEAKLTIGEDRVLVEGASTDIITTDTSTIVTIELDTSTQNIGTTLSIWPRINGDKTVTLDIEQSNTSLNKNSGTLPISNGLGDILNINIDSVTESAIELTAIARHGATIAIGGMIETDVQEIHEKVPFLGDIPVLGKLFRKDYSKDVRSELIILITPWVSENPENIHVLNKERSSNWTSNPEFSSHLSAPEDNDTPVHWALNVRKNAIAIIRNAVAVERTGSDPLVSCKDRGLYSASRFSDWKINDSLLISAQHHCQIDGLFLSQAVVNNTTDREKHLRPDLFNQGWVASHGESTLLPPNTSQIMYFVSTTAPEILLRHQQETFFYGEGALDVQ